LTGAEHTLSNECSSQAVSHEEAKGRRWIQRSIKRLFFSLLPAKKAIESRLFPI
jgi:hypothetical protein